MLMKTQLEKMKKEQFNTRIPSDLKRGLRIVSAVLDWTVEDVTEIALASLFGSKDKTVIAKRHQVESVAKQLSLSFNGPAPPPQGGMQMAA